MFDAARVLGHSWHAGGFWAPITTKLEALEVASDNELAAMSCSSLFGLLNFCQEYVPAFSELTEPIRGLLG